MRRIVAVGAAGLVLAACGTAQAVAASGPVARAARQLASEPVHFCFVTTATAQTGSERIAGCGIEADGGSRLALTEQLDEAVGAQTQQGSEGVIAIGRRLWVSQGKTWHVEPATPAVIAPANVAAVLEATPASSWQVGRGGVVDGVQTLAYSAKLSGAALTRVLGALSGSLRSQYEAESIRQADIAVEVSQAGRILEVDQRQTLSGQGQVVEVVSVLVLSKLGVPVSITPPPARLVVG
jgi:hypothetical protein